MIATNKVSLRPGNMNEDPSPATDGRSERQNVAQAMVRGEHDGEIGNFGVFRWAQSRGWPCASVAEGDKEMGSVQAGGIQTGGWLACLDEVSQDLEDLRGVGDHGDNLHRVVTTRTA